MKHTKYLSLAIFLLAVLTLTFVGCDKRSFEPDSFFITEFVAPDSLSSGVETTIQAHVVNKEGVPASGETVTFKTTRGIIQAKAVTDDFGVATATFSHFITSVDPVSANVEAFIHKSQASAIIWLSKHLGDHTVFSLTASPSEIYADNNITTSEIRALIKDNDGYGAPDKSVRFQTNIGQVTSIAVTDDSGVATAIFADNGEMGNAVIKATIEESFKEVNVTVLPVLPEYVITMTATPSIIYADNNITFSTIKATVVDGIHGFPVIEETVRFRSSLGNIVSQVMTDNMGIATTTFYDGGIVLTEPVVAYIEARIGNASAEVAVNIDFTPLVGSVVLFNVLPVYDMERVRGFGATVKDINGNNVSDGTLVTFSTTKGSFSEESIVREIVATTLRGDASVTFFTGTEAGSFNVSAEVGNLSDSAASTINPGLPAAISLTAQYRDPGTDLWIDVPASGLPVNYHGDVRIRANVRDLYTNPVSAGNAILFETTLGGIQDIAATDENGIAYAVFYHGVSSGTAQITATAVMPSEDQPAIGTTVLTFFSNEVQSIRFVDQENMYLNVQGVGGQESVELRVQLRDYNGNLVSGQHEIIFTIVHEPALDHPSDIPCNINNAGSTDTVLSNNGIAVASLNSGTKSGTVQVKASLATNTNISATKTNIVITGGPPVTVVPFIGQFDTGVSLGGGLWLIQAGAFVSDEYGNPVINGTAVSFALSNNPTPPPHTSIFGGGYVGNPSLDDEDGTPGVAYTTMIYHGLYTYRQVEIIAESGGVTGTSSDDGEIERLPIQQPRMEMQVNPGYHEYFPGPGGTNPASQPAELNISLLDGQGNAITGAVILLTSSHGFFQYFYHPVNWPYNQPYQMTPERVVTYQGMAKGTIVTRGWEAPQPEEEWFTTVDVQINSFLQGTNTLAQTTLTIRRYRDPHGRAVFEQVNR